SFFECEMRRRLWTLLTEIDLLVAFQFGLPSNVQRQYFDTGLPHNLLDEDFDENTSERPTERPETERTPALYTIVKSRIVVAFGDILSTVMSRHSPTYGEVLRIDKRLEEAYEAIPPLLKHRSFSLSITDPVDIIMQRLWIELMYQKARIVLHRRYFTKARHDTAYGESHWACMHASEKILQHQFEIHNEMLPGGRLAKERWFLSSLSTHDFLLANMMLALELSHKLPKDGHEAGDPGLVDRESLLTMISTSRNIWQARCEESVEAVRAFKILSRMLTIATGVQYDMVPRVAVVEAVVPSQRPSYQYAHGMNLRDFAENHSRQGYGEEAHMVWSADGQGVPVAAPGPGQWQHNPASFAVPMPMPEPMVDAGQGLDWVGLVLALFLSCWANICDRPTGTPRSSTGRTRTWRFRGPTSSTTPRPSRFRMPPAVGEGRVVFFFSFHVEFHGHHAFGSSFGKRGYRSGGNTCSMRCSIGGGALGASLMVGRAVSGCLLSQISVIANHGLGSSPRVQ
ncbi:fungal specific transcription factor domain-containing protein, partial [Candidatus Bathyarchaeota archaeon]|nr:fungal specific transcription factor domain-containing protein [Candidatus Bathyarchaeota archaeon]